MEESHITVEEFEKQHGHKFGDGKDEIILDGSSEDFGPPKDGISFFPEWLELFVQFRFKIEQDDKTGVYYVVFRRSTDENYEFTGVKLEYFNAIRNKSLIFDNYHEAKCYVNLIKIALIESKL